jgi:branched-chain amino acid transport system substrate-binding protein
VKIGISRAPFLLHRWLLHQGLLRQRPLHLALSVLGLSGGLMLAGCAPNLPPPQAPSQPQAATPAPTPISPSEGLTTPAAPATAKVALLLPLSGQNAAIGRTLMQAAEMGVFDSAGDDFSLVVRDSAALGGPGGAVRSAMQEGAKLVLGPVFSTEIVPAAQAAGSLIPIVSF